MVLKLTCPDPDKPESGQGRAVSGLRETSVPHVPRASGIWLPRGSGRAQVETSRRFRDDAADGEIRGIRGSGISYAPVTKGADGPSNPVPTAQRCLSAI